MIQRTVTLRQDVRAFQRYGGPDSKMLCQCRGPSPISLPQGTEVTIDDVDSMIYDHRDHTVAYVLLDDGEGCYVLVSELAMPELLN